ncbi:MAG: sugar ABC transporter substrate-binding protein [Anaerolineae bacterium]|nr:sugar ABC transporter substrate-binding protein [Anaerolineae bacterium]
MKKAWLVGLVVCLLLAGCGGTPGKQVSFMVFGDPAELAAYQQLAAAFEAKRPDIQVELRHAASQGDYQKQLVTAFSAGAEPDVMLLNYRRVLQFAAQGGLEPLGPYLDKSQALRAADLYPEALEAFQWNGQTWCVPQNISSLVVYYNRSLFDAAGVAYPTAGWTWDDFLQTARALTRDLDGDGQTDQYGAGMSPGLMRLAPFVWQNGGELVDDPARPTRLALDSPAALEALQWFVDLQVRERVVPDATAEQAEESESRFMNGRLGMFLNSRRGVPTYRTIANLDWDVAPLPQGVQAAGILHSDAYCLATRARDKESAWALIEFANSVEGQTLMAGTGRTVPSLRQVAESPAFLDPQQRPDSSQVFLDTIPVLRRLPLLAKWPIIEETASREIERAFYGQASVEEAAAAAISLTMGYFEE